MKSPDIPTNEANRLAVLKSFEILDTFSEQEFDDITSLASQACGVPIALISLIDENRQWFKSKVGLSTSETSRDVSFCAHAINSNDLFEVPNALQDERFADNPLVTGAQNIRFYAGVPLTTADGLNLGTLCVLDNTPRKLDDTQRRSLESLSRLVMRLIEGRLHAIQQLRIQVQLTKERAALHESNERVRLALAAAKLGVWDWDIQTGMVIYDERWYEMLGYDYRELEFSLSTFKKLLHPDDVASTSEALEAHLKTKADSYDIEFRMLHKAGHIVWINSIGRVMERDAAGMAVRMLGTHMDISERKAAELIIEAREKVIVQIGMLAKVGGWSLDLINNTLYWTDDVKRIHEVEMDYVPSVESAISFYKPEGQAIISEAVARGINTGESWDVELPLVTAKGNEIWVRAQGNPVIIDGKIVSLTGAVQDITRYKLAEEEIKQLAFYDTLTRLPNRRLLFDRLEQVIFRTKRNKCFGALLFIDLDNLKKLNDTLGHAKGDDLLKQVANRLLESVRDTDIVSRLGGDEFVVVLDSLSRDQYKAKEQALLVGNKIINALNQRYFLGWDKFDTSTSIGVALLNGEQNSNSLLKNADTAMYQAKADGRNCMRFFDESMLKK